MGKRRTQTSGKIENYELVVFGSGAVGKTSLVKRLVSGDFTSSYTPTVGDVYRYFLRFNNRLFNLTIVDSSGTHDFPAMKELSIKECAAFVLVLAADDRQSFEHFKKDFLDVVQRRPDAKIVIVANKIDTPNRTVSAIDVVSYLEEQRAKYPHYRCKYLETSAKNNHNVREVFNETVRLLKPVFSENKTKKLHGLARTCTIL